MIYQFEIKGPDGIIKRGMSQQPNFKFRIKKPAKGPWTYRVRLVDDQGRKSAWVAPTGMVSNHQRGVAIDINWPGTTPDEAEEYELLVGEYGELGEGCGFPMHPIEFYIN